MNTPMPWNENLGLDPEQLRAATHMGQPACLLAGPGTGKTRSLTGRVAYLVMDQQVPPSNIVALTFTRAAAAELRKSVKSLLGEDVVLPMITTLHSYALTTILASPRRNTLTIPLRIADEHEVREIIEKELKRIVPLSDVKEARNQLNMLAADWACLAHNEDGGANRRTDARFYGAWQEHRRIYGYTLLDELVSQLNTLLETGELQLTSIPDHLLVDEYQDLNPCELAVVLNIANSGAQLFCAGDDDQSIYGFRHGHPEGIRQFDEDYDPAIILTLTECKRCDRRILEWGLHVADQDPRRLDKPLRAASQMNGEARLLSFPDQYGEARGIAQICQWLIQRREIPEDEILILTRTDRYKMYSKVIRAALEELGIPVRTATNPLEPLDDPQGRKFLCLLRLRRNRGDHLAWRTILGLPGNGVGDITFSALYELALERSLTFTGTLDLVKNDPNIVARGRLVKDAVEEIEPILDVVSDSDLEDLPNFLVTFANTVIDNEETRAAVLGVFNSVFAAADIRDIDHLLAVLNVALSEAEQAKERGSITISTMHRAKGLSADAVFVVGAEDEVIPGDPQRNDEADERRLLYVSLTRARHFLFATHCHQRVGYQSHSGRNSGDPARSLTRFLRGGSSPVRSENGNNYVRSLLNVTC